MIRVLRIVRGDASRLSGVEISLVNMETADPVMIVRIVPVNSGKMETVKKATTVSFIIPGAEVLGHIETVVMLLQPHLPLPVPSMVPRILTKSGMEVTNHVLDSPLANVVKVTIANSSIEIWNLGRSTGVTMYGQTVRNLVPKLPLPPALVDTGVKVLVRGEGNQVTLGNLVDPGGPVVRASLVGLRARVARVANVADVNAAADSLPLPVPEVPGLPGHPGPAGVVPLVVVAVSLVDPPTHAVPVALPGLEGVRAPAAPGVAVAHALAGARGQGEARITTNVMGESVRGGVVMGGGLLPLHLSSTWILTHVLISR